MNSSLISSAASARAFAMAGAAAITLALSGRPALAEITCSGNPPCVTKVTEKKVGDKLYLNVHYRGICKFDHYNLRVEGLPAVKITETANPNVLCASQPALYGPVENNKKYTFSISGCVHYVVGNDRCTGFSTPVSFTPGAKQRSEGARCREYALKAGEIRKEAITRFNCNPKDLTGSRWNASYTEHYTWCLGVSSATAASETAARNKELQECRVKAAGPKGGDAQIQVYKAGNFFIVNGSGFAPNAPVVVRLSGSGAASSSITTHHNQRIVANAAGRITLRLPYPFVCKPGSGIVFLTAEDQDNRRSPVVRQICSA